MELTVKRNTAANSAQVPYFIQVDMQSSNLDLSRSLHVPVYEGKTNRNVTYAAMACGYEVHDPDFNGLALKLDRLIRSIAVTNRLPTYVFVARHARELYLVYSIDDEVVTGIPGGPTFRHVELAKIREYLTDYLQKSGVLGTPDKPDKLHVRGVHRKSLALIRPIFYLKKRAMFEGDNEFWAPVFLSDNGQSIFTYAASKKQEVPWEGGKGALELYQKVAKALIADHRLSNLYDMRLDRLFPEQWEQLKSTLILQDTSITAHGITLPVFKNGKSFVSVENRPDENRVGLFFGKDPADVESRVIQSFNRRGIGVPA